jgi:hypothetical protein
MLSTPNVLIVLLPKTMDSKAVLLPHTRIQIREELWAIPVQGKQRRSAEQIKRGRRVVFTGSPEPYLAKINIRITLLPPPVDILAR